MAPVTMHGPDLAPRDRFAASHDHPHAVDSVSYAEFQERFEREAEAEYERYLALPAEVLVDAVRAGEFGTYYSLWRAVGVRASVDQAGWPLYDVIAGDAPYLVRYHAAAALLSLLQSRRFVAADLAVESPRQREWIGVVRDELQARYPR